MARILVVEDDALIQRLIRLSLMRKGHELVESDNGSNALECLEFFEPDLILLDMRLPVMDGWQFLKTYLEATEHPAHIILISAGYVDTDTIGLSGVVDCLTKPFSADVLMNCVEKHLAS